MTSHLFADLILRLPKRAIKKTSLDVSEEITSVDIAKRLEKELLDFGKQPFIVHITGTNGKGSVTHKIAASLALSGYKVGVYTSPHLISLYERIQIFYSENQRLVSELIEENVFEVLAKKVLNGFEKSEIQPSFFEAMTMVGMLFFELKNVDALVIEVGLGGRFDTTNFVRSDVSVITSIALDHQAILGTTVKEIAWHKAGIIKNDQSVVLGCTPHQIILDEAFSKNAKVVLVNNDQENYEIKNQNTAKAALDVIKKSLNLQPEAIDEGVKMVPFGRYSRLKLGGCDVIIDAAHNVEGVEHLLVRLEKDFPARRKSFCLAFCEDKDFQTILSLITSHSERIYLPKVNTPRIASFELLSSKIDSEQFDKIIFESKGADCLDLAFKECKTRKDLLVITGSFYLLQHFLKKYSR